MLHAAPTDKWWFTRYRVALFPFLILARAFLDVLRTTLSCRVTWIVTTKCRRWSRVYRQGWEDRTHDVGQTANLLLLIFISQNQPLVVLVPCSRRHSLKSFSTVSTKMTSWSCLVATIDHKWFFFSATLYWTAVCHIESVGTLDIDALIIYGPYLHRVSF